MIRRSLSLSLSLDRSITYFFAGALLKALVKLAKFRNAPSQQMEKFPPRGNRRTGVGLRNRAKFRTRRLPTALQPVARRTSREGKPEGLTARRINFGRVAVLNPPLGRKKILSRNAIPDRCCTVANMKISPLCPHGVRCSSAAGT